jgi:hypothetical protein
MSPLFFDLFYLLLIWNDVDYDFVDHTVRKIVFVEWKHFHHHVLLWWLVSIFLVYWKMMMNDGQENLHVVFVIWKMLSNFHHLFVFCDDECQCHDVYQNHDDDDLKKNLEVKLKWWIYYLKRIQFVVDYILLLLL